MIHALVIRAACLSSLFNLVYPEVQKLGLEPRAPLRWRWQHNHATDSDWKHDGKAASITCHTVLPPRETAAPAGGTSSRIASSCARWEHSAEDSHVGAVTA